MIMQKSKDLDISDVDLEWYSTGIRPCYWCGAEVDQQKLLEIKQMKKSEIIYSDAKKCHIECQICRNDYWIKTHIITIDLRKGEKNEKRT